MLLSREIIFFDRNDVSLYNIDMLIFLDETGADIRNSVRLQFTWNASECTSAVAMMSTKGILAM